MTSARINEIVGDAALRASVERRLWQKVDASGDGCWMWTAKARHMFGYGVLSTPGNRTVNAHALVWALANGSIPVGAHILHHCDVPGCCNPQHLYCGTNAQNRADMVSRGRQRKGGHTAETIRKIKTARAANPPKQTEKSRLARSEALRRRWANPLWRERFSEMMSGKGNHRFGKRPTEAQMDAAKNNHRSKAGYRHSEETKNKIREAALRRRGI